MRRVLQILMLLVGIVVMPTAVFAQATLTGLVRDTSGGVLPGVTVEAASDVLIEKVRTSVTDGTGRYQIIDLRPGAYVVTFTLGGFATIVREGVQLQGTATVTINADMQIGGLQETITVSGETPTVDLQSTTRQTSIDQEVVAAIPSSRNSFAVGVLIPGTTLNTGNDGQDVGGALGPTTNALITHGGRTADQRLLMNGVALSTMIGGGWGGGAIPNATGTQEFAIDTAAVDATAATGGVRINFIPRDGGNRYSGTIFTSYAGESFTSDNLDQELIDAGLPAVGNVKRNLDFNPGFGGPLVRDQVWFFFSGRYQVADQYIPGMFYNKNTNNPDVWVYEADLSKPAVGPRKWNVYQARFTYQASPKNKIGFTFDQESNCFCPDGISATTSPDAAGDRSFDPQRFMQLDWNSPVSNRLLLEASIIHRVERWGGQHRYHSGAGIPNQDPRMIRVTEATTGLNYRADSNSLNSWNYNVHYRAAASYITGSHVMKIGFNNAWGQHERDNYSAQDIPYEFRFRNGVPERITLRALPYQDSNTVRADLGIFVQDKWTTGQWTLSGGVRYDYFNHYFKEQRLGPTVWTPDRNIVFPEKDNLSLSDITPKLGATYDVFGDGRTAVKVTLNKYLGGLGTTGAITRNAADNLRIATTTNVVWNDLNGDFNPDCDLLNSAGGGECGPWSSSAFGSPLPANTYEPRMQTGWNNREYNWEFSAGVQHEVIPRVSVDVSFFRRWYGNLLVTDDRNRDASSYDTFQFSAPTDSLLGPNSGRTLTAINETPEIFGTPEDNIITLAKYIPGATPEKEIWSGVDFSANARLQNLTVQGGISVGRLIQDNCELVQSLPEMRGDTPIDYCRAVDAWQNNIKGLAAYEIVPIEVQISATFQSLPGEQVSTLYDIRGTPPGLGRPITGSAVRVELTEPGSVYRDRLNQVDFRVAKLLRFAGTRTSVNFDFYNVFNANPILNESSLAWRRPTVILQPRFFKIGVQFDF